MGIGVLLVVGLLYVILNQIYTEQMAPHAIDAGVYAPNANLISFAWKIVLVPVLIAVVYSWINKARKRMGGGYE